MPSHISPTWQADGSFVFLLLLVDARELFAEALALDETAAMAVALNVDRVVVRVHVAGAVADGVQALDGLALGVDNLEVVGNRDAANNGEQAGSNLGRIEGTLLDGEQEVRFLVEVGVFALLANLVVALDGLLGLVDVDVELLEQFVDGVGNLVVVGGLLDAFLHRLGMGSGRIGRRGAHSAERIPEHAAAELERCGVVGLEVGVENRPAVVVAAVDLVPTHLP